MENQKRILTKNKMITSAYRLNQKDRNLFVAASKTEGISRSEFLRLAIRERALRILDTSPTPKMQVNAR
jgi:hypothetical protein